MPEGNVTWYLGADLHGIREPIQAVERYRQNGLAAGSHHWSTVVVLAVCGLVCVPLVLVRGLGLFLFAPLVILADRGVRRLRGVPNDVVVVLTDQRVIVFHAHCSLARGWVMKDTIATWARGEVHAAGIGPYFELRVAPSGQGEPLYLVPSHPTAAAAAIASALQGPDTSKEAPIGSKDPMWVR